jgi:hypothetical protein
MIGLGLSITQLAVRQLRGASFSPLSLFAAGEPGAWYDPSDMSTLFQDAAGTQPVTAVEQAVGLMLDKSKGLVLGPELVSNGDFSNGSTGWVLSSGVTIQNQQAVFTNVTGSNNGLVALGLLSAGKRYRVTFSVLSIASGQVSAFFSGNSSALVSAPGTYTFTINAGSTTTNFGIIKPSSSPDVNCVIDNISVRELPGNHAFQATAINRPVLSARYNLLTNTETLATQTVATAATTQRLRFEGTGTITLSGTATGTYSAGSHTFTTTAGNLTLTVSGSVTKADLRASNDGVGLPAYQRVGAGTIGNSDYDTAGFPMYLRFNGVNWWMQTGNVNFTSTDKMTVWAGVRKFNSGTSNQIVGVSDIDNTTTAKFQLFADSANSGVARWISAGLPNGNASSIASSILTPAPVTVVFTATGDISAPRNEIFVNGVSGGVNTFNQGSGNHANLPINIGAGPASPRYLSGCIYSLIVRGAQSTTQQIADTETWVNGKTGAY